MKRNLAKIAPILALALTEWPAHAQTDIEQELDGGATSGPTFSEQIIRVADNADVLGVVAIPGGGSVAVGVTRSDDTYADAWISQLTATGQIRWLRSLPVENWQDFSDVAIDRHGHIYAVGSNLAGSLGLEGWIVAFDLAGDLLWERTYGGSGNDSIAAIERSSRGMIIAGTREAEDDGAAQGWLAEIDADGQTVWETTLSLENQVWFSDLAMLDDHSIVAVGRTTDADGLVSSIAARFSREHGIIWTDVPDDSGGYTGVTKLPGGGVAVSGVAQWQTGAPLAGIVKVLGQDGKVVWHDEINGFEPGAIVAGPDGQIIVTGQGYAAGAPRAMLRFYTGVGGLEREISPGNSEGSNLWSVSISPVGQIVAGGTHIAPGDGETGQAWVITGLQDHAIQTGETE